MAASVLGGGLSEARFWIAKIGGIVVAILGIHMTGLIRIPFLEYDLRPTNNSRPKPGLYFFSFARVIFSAGGRHVSDPH
jgi:cytochrome c-type biogenesis protein